MIGGGVYDCQTLRDFLVCLFYGFLFFKEEKMKRKIYLVSFIIVSLFAIFLTYCGEDKKDEKIQWTCSCTANCDGNEATVSETACGTESEAQKAVEEGVSSCKNELSSKCSDIECECNCTPTGNKC